ncbi:MAG: sulfotransferase [Nanoarchaeota archaeon]|nr:sulfotransferase [Nanoarchaeota archaeon]
MRTVIILGMHRSATSMIARTLHKSGEVFMGEKKLLQGKGNKAGHFEDLSFLKLNEEILEAAGGSWENPPDYSEIMALKNEFKEKIKNAICIASSFAKDLGFKSWGFKDPRSILTIDLYMPFLPNPQFIITHRNSKDIAKSLNKRSGMPIKEGVALSKIYNIRLKNFINSL